jgi:HNH endonuclease
MKRCDRCLGRVRPGERFCDACVASNLRSQELRKKRAAQDPWGAIRNGEGKGINKTTLPLGAVVIRKHNGHESRFIKIRMDGESGRRWMPYAKWWWEKNRGPLPPGHLVLHKDGDPLNDDPKNLVAGSPGLKLVFAHQRDPAWSRAQHERAAAGCAEWNRQNGRANRDRNFIKNYWYPVVDNLGVILNVPFRKQKRLLACFGVDVSRYPANGRGKKAGSAMQRVLRSSPVRPVPARELGLRRFATYCLIEPVSKSCRGPMSMSAAQLIAQLERMGIWEISVKQARRDLKDRNSYAPRSENKLSIIRA